MSWLARLALVVSGALLPSLGAVVTAPAAAPLDYCAARADTGAMVCSDTEAGLDQLRRVAFAAPAGSSDALVAPTASVLLGVFYDNANYDSSAGYLQWWGTAACTTSTGDIDSSWSDTTTWRSRISSFQGKGGCRVQIWYSTNYTGASNGSYQSQNPSLGTLNDRVWSARFT